MDAVPEMAISLKDFKDAPSGDSEKSRSRTTALVTGSVALGALVTSAVLEKARHRKYPVPIELPPALSADLHELEIMEGVTRFYVRPGEGVPLVLLHAISAAGSSFEMKPVFDHFARATNRPLYALEWFGFGRSDRPPVRYSPGLYQRQLRRTLSEVVSDRADVVALSLSAEYAATVANAFPVLVQRLVLISPTGMDARSNTSIMRNAVVGTAGRAGFFELMYSRLTTREALRTFFARQIFSAGADVPEDLLDYAYLTSHARGAHHAPRHFISGSLFMGDYSRRGFETLRVPSLVIVPDSPPSSLQDFGEVGEIASANELMSVHRLPTGLLPHWERPDEVLPLIEEFLQTDTDPVTRQPKGRQREEGAVME